MLYCLFVNGDSHEVGVFKGSFMSLSKYKYFYFCFGFLFAIYELRKSYNGSIRERYCFELDIEKRFV
jgi:hypothetical protein